MTMNDQEIGKYIESLDKEVKSIKENIISICWWMRGGITYSEAWNLSELERSSVSKLIKQNQDTMKKTGIHMI